MGAGIIFVNYRSVTDKKSSVEWVIDAPMNKVTRDRWIAPGVLLYLLLFCTKNSKPT